MISRAREIFVALLSVVTFLFLPHLAIASATISGTVYKSDGITPITGIPARTYYLRNASRLTPETYEAPANNSGEPHYEIKYDMDLQTWDGAGDVIVQAGNPSMANDIPIAWSIFNAHEADGSLVTRILVWILDGFTGTLPGALDTITVTGPSGVLPYTKANFTYKTFTNPPWSGLWGSFDLTLPGSPALGEYTVNVVSGTNQSGIQKDVQTANRSIPIIDTATFTPGNGATVSSKTPSFSWVGIDYSEAPIYYQLQIEDMLGNYVYFSPREKGMVAWTLPVGILTPGETYQWRVMTSDDSDYTRIQNRSYTEWFTFTMAGTLTHGALPAIDGGSTLGVTTWYNHYEGATDLLFWASITDHDGVASDGSSHTLSVTFPDGTTTVPMYASTLNSKAYLFDEKQIRTATRVFYQGYVDLQGNPAPPGTYTFTVTDPDGKVGTMVDDLVVSPLDPPDVSTLSPSLAGEQITAFFDDVYVNGALFDDFDSYADISDLDPGKWNPPPAGASIDSGRVKIIQANMVGGGNCELTLKDPGSASSIQADITVSSISSNAAQARVYGFFYNNGNGDVFARVSVTDGTVNYAVYEFLVGDSLTPNPIGGGDLMSVTPGQTVTVSIAWDGTVPALTFSADGNVATFTPTGPVYSTTRFGSKAIGTRITLALPNTTPAFTVAPVVGANQYSMRFHDDWDDYVIWNVYAGNTPSITVPPGLLKPNTF